MPGTKRQAVSLMLISIRTGPFSHSRHPQSATPAAMRKGQVAGHAQARAIDARAQRLLGRSHLLAEVLARLPHLAGQAAAAQ